MEMFKFLQRFHERKKLGNIGLKYKILNRYFRPHIQKFESLKIRNVFGTLYRGGRGKV